MSHGKLSSIYIYIYYIYIYIKYIHFVLYSYTYNKTGKRNAVVRMISIFVARNSKYIPGKGKS